MSDCLFCKFVSKEFSTDIVFENEDFIIFKDIAPMAKNHFLAVPKKHFKYLSEMQGDDPAMLGRILKKISELSDLLGLQGGYRLVKNQGDDAGQTVPHWHIHVLSGQKMAWNPA